MGIKLNTHGREQLPRHLCPPARQLGRKKPGRSDYQQAGSPPPQTVHYKAKPPASKARAYSIPGPSQWPDRAAPQPEQCRHGRRDGRDAVRRPDVTSMVKHRV